MYLTRMRSACNRASRSRAFAAKAKCKGAIRRSATADYAKDIMFTPTPLRMLISFVAVVMLTAPIRAGTGKMMTVAADGSGDFASVQAAVDAAPAGSADRIVIHIK